MPKSRLTPEQIQDIQTQYLSKNASQDELAHRYGVGTTTIRRALAEAGLVKYSAHATRKERDMLSMLNTFGIDTTQRLFEVLQRGT